MPQTNTQSRIDHVEATAKVYYTRDYSRFKMILGNRTLNQSKINKIIRDIDNGIDMLKYCPIVVDNDMNVIDGQHRLSVAKKLKSNIWYMIMDNTPELYDIAKINSNTDRWKTKDFLKCYIATGNDQYIMLKKFLETYQINISTAINLLMFGYVASGGNHNAKKHFESGTFVVNFIKKANQIGDTCLLFKNHPCYNKRSFVHAIAVIMESNKCDFDRLLKNFNTNPQALDSCSDYKNYLTALEIIYNRNKQHRDILY